ncbi:MAG TPA: crosslink repair DNA glycosylase YcaQ family protein [Candidatus Limnocylindrales bacterium]|nr:crosslink repair DNA glycosylase YcaQ family protein [Candidatus Limnocylindrales bacterium]
MAGARLSLTRDQVLRHRQRAGQLDARRPLTPESLRHAAWAGLPDSMPRAALLSLHARVGGIEPTSWEHPSLVQVWGPRFSDYVISADDIAPFTLGRMPDDAAGLRRAETAADRLEAHLDGRRMGYGQAGHGIGVHPNSLRYGATTGRILIRWEGARQPIVWTIPAPAMPVSEARADLLRRYLHVLGPGSIAGFARWAGIRPGGAKRTFETMAGELVEVDTTVGERWIRADDESSVRAGSNDRASGIRFLPSGDTYVLLWGADRELVVPDAAGRAAVWTSRVWPGTVLVDGKIAGTWRRADTDLAVEPLRPLTATERAAIEAEATSLPLGLSRPIRVRWSG